MVGRTIITRIPRLPRKVPPCRRDQRFSLKPLYLIVTHGHPRTVRQAEVVSKTVQIHYLRASVKIVVAGIKFYTLGAGVITARLAYASAEGCPAPQAEVAGRAKS